MLKFHHIIGGSDIWPIKLYIYIYWLVLNLDRLVKIYQTLYYTLNCFPEHETVGAVRFPPHGRRF